MIITRLLRNASSALNAELKSVVDNVAHSRAKKPIGTSFPSYTLSNADTLRPDALLRRETHRPLKPLLQIPRSRAPLLLPQTDNPNIPPSPSNRSILPTRPRPPRLLHERTLAVSIRNANGQNQPKGHNPSHRKISAAACQSHQTRQTHGYHGFT